MKLSIGRNQIVPALMGVVGFLLGYLLFHDDSKALESSENQIKSAHLNDSAFTNRNGTVQTRAHPSGLDPESLAKEKAFSEEARRGYYVLKYERPFMRKRLEDLINRATLDWYTPRATEYTHLFHGMNIQPEVTDKFIKHAEKIYRASMEAEAAIQQLAQARSDFIEQLERELSPEDRTKFRNLEDARQVNHE